MGEMVAETFAGRPLEMPIDYTQPIGLNWNPHEPKEVEHAKAKYTELLSRGYVAFGAGIVGAEKMTEFDAEAGAAIFGNEEMGTRVRTMLVLDKTGHVKVLWDPHNDISVEAAKKQFDFLKSKGFVAHKVNKDGTDSRDIVHTFDPKLEHLSMSPATVGG